MQLHIHLRVDGGAYTPESVDALDFLEFVWLADLNLFSSSPFQQRPQRRCFCSIRKEKETDKRRDK